MADDGNDAAVAAPLPDDQRALLASGLLQWLGPAHATPAFAVAAGFADVDDLIAGADRLSGLIGMSAPLTAREWTQAQLLIEVAFASDLLGVGDDWPAVTPFDDVRTIALLRALQHLLVPIVSPALLERPRR